METLHQFFALPIADQARIIQAVASVVGLGCILGGLVQMGRAGARRNKEIDVLAENMRESTRMVGQALERQGETMTEALQGLRQQGEVLAELLRRSTPA